MTLTTPNRAGPGRVCPGRAFQLEVSYQWALWDDTDVDIRTDPLDVGHRHYRRAIQHAARLLKIHIPAEWR
jgi:hypothetical protein